MALMLKYKCEGCGHKFELESPRPKTLQCPACSGGDMRPEGRKPNIVGIVSVISWLVVLILGLLIVLALVTSRGRDKARLIEEDLLRAEEQRRMEEVRLHQAFEAEQRRWGELEGSVVRGNIRLEADYRAALKKIEDYAGGDPDDKNQLRLKLEGFKAEDVKAIISSLEERAKPFDADSEYVKAAAVFQDYKGDYEEDTRGDRRRLADAYLRKAADVREAQRLADQKARDGREAAAVVRKLASDLLSSGIPDSVAAFNASGHADELPEVSGMVAAISKINETVLETFAEQAGQEVQIALRGKKLPVLVKGVEDGQMLCEYTESNVRIVKKLALRDFDEMEILRRLASKDLVSADLVAGIRAASQKKFEAAERHFQNLGQLSMPLLAELGRLKDAHEAAMRAAAVKEEKPERDPGPLDPSRIRVDAKVTRSGKSNKDLGEVEERMNLRLEIVNGTGQGVEGYTLLVALVGESVLDKRKYKIIETYQEELKVSERSKIERIHPVTNTYNQGTTIQVLDQNSRVVPGWGYKYHSWLWVIKDPTGKIRVAKARNSKFEKNAESIIANPDAEIDQDGSVIKPGG